MQMERQTLVFTSKSYLKMDPRLSSAQFVERVLVTTAVLRSMWKIFTFLTHLFTLVGFVVNSLPKRTPCTNTFPSSIKLK